MLDTSTVDTAVYSSMKHHTDTLVISGAEWSISYFGPRTPAKESHISVRYKAVESIYTAAKIMIPSIQKKELQSTNLQLVTPLTEIAQLIVMCLK
jgi:hypothetical protein